MCSFGWAFKANFANTNRASLIDAVQAGDVQEELCGSSKGAKRKGWWDDKDRWFWYSLTLERCPNLQTFRSILKKSYLYFDVSCSS